MRLRSILAVAFTALTLQGYAQTMGTWSNTGPVLFPVNVSGQVDGMGRVSQLKFHNSDPAKIYAVSSSGGLFITNDTGRTWAPTAGTEALPTTACSAVCIDYTNDNILYLSTGDQNYYSDWYGIYKSVDGGNTWNPANVNIGNRMAVEILMDPLNHNKIIAATDDGIWVSTDAAATWTQTQAGVFKSMKQKPGSNHILYAATADMFYRSTNMGATWTNITAGVVVPAMNEGIRIAVTPADTNIVFLGTTGGYGEILKSTNGGTSFSNIYTSDTQCIVCYDSTITSGSQGYYNFNLTVNPANANELLLVSHCVWRSTDGGLTWSWRTQWWNQVHTDMHDIEFDPYDLSKRFDANDGGVWLSRDTLATFWTPSSDGLSATEIYHAAQSPVTRQMVSIGTQDNGELYFDGVWKCNRGGDWGAHCFFDYLSNSTVYYVDNGNRRNLAPLGGDQTYNSPFVPTGGANMEFVSTLHNEVFAGKDTLWRSTDINTSSPTWTQMYVPGGDNILSIASCKADNNILYFVTDNNHVYRSDNAQSATPTFTLYTAPWATNVAASLATDRYNANIVYLTCGTRVYRSANKGVSWTNVTGTLPALNVLKIIADEYSTNERLFVCMGSYVYYKDNSIPWTLTNGLPTVASITDFMMYNDSTSGSILRLSTYGRGVWEVNINNNFPPSGIFTADKQYLCPGDTVHYTKTLYGDYTSFSWSFPGGSPSTSTAASPVVVYPSVGTYNATLTLIGPGGNDTITRTAYITVSNGGGAITEGFEETFFPPSTQWTQISASGVYWQHTDSCGGYGLSTKSMYFDNFDNDAGGRHDRMITPKINLTMATSAYLTFDVAYAYYTGYHDSLQVDISTDCGRTFTSIYEKDSAALATAPNTSASFVPTSTQWRTDTIYLTPYLGHEIQLAFDNIGHYGENIYIDNINLGGALAVQNMTDNDRVQVFPNPTTGIVNINAQGLKGNNINITCYNILGATVSRKTEELVNGILNTSMNLSAMPKGIYELKLEDNSGNTFVKQIVLQ